MSHDSVRDAPPADRPTPTTEAQSFAKTETTCAATLELLVVVDNVLRLGDADSLNGRSFHLISRQMDRIHVYGTGRHKREKK